MANNFTKKFHVFRNPVELLLHYDEDLLNEVYTLYPWQVETMLKFAEGTSADKIQRMVVLAANGSGKSQYLLAPCIAWLAVAFEQSLGYVTSSSASQLDTQTERFLDRLAKKMNVKEQGLFKQDIWTVVKRKKVFLPNESYVDLFATDEAGKAEGKHPLRIGGEFGIFIDEGKNILPEIYGAIERCTGATRRFDVSSAGSCHGHLYDICTRPELGWWVRKIIWSDCPHIRREEFDQAIAKYGPNDPGVRSIFFSEFTSVDDKVILTRENMALCDTIFRGEIRNRLHAGLDLSGGGDETVLSVWNGNVQIAVETCRFSNTSLGVREIITWCQRHKLKADQVWVEYDGFNKPMVNNLAEKGWEFNRVISGSAAFDKIRYGNKMTELWFKFRRYVEEQCVSLLPDTVMREQFVNRYYRKQLNSDKIILERKEEAKSKGHPSPDRADASVLAFAAWPDVDEFIIEFGKDFKTPIVPEKKKELSKNFQFSRERMREEYEERFTYGNEGEPKQRARPVNSSVSCLDDVDPEDLVVKFSEIEEEY